MRETEIKFRPNKLLINFSENWSHPQNTHDSIDILFLAKHPTLLLFQVRFYFKPTPYLCAFAQFYIIFEITRIEIIIR